MAFAVAHSDGVLLFDTGVGVGHREVDTSYRPTHYRLDEALARHGFSLPDVVAVANSHLHFDHCGQNRMFAGRPTYVQGAEWAALQPDYTVAEWVDLPGARYELLDGEAELLPGVRAVPTPGHSPGHQSLVVDTESGPILLAGQAVYTLDEWEGKTNPRLSGRSSAWDAEQYGVSVRRLRDLRPVRVMFAHDQRMWERGGR
jgi:N-acyl homoserine lactone hydrolase